MSAAKHRVRLNICYVFIESRYHSEAHKVSDFQITLKLVQEIVHLMSIVMKTVFTLWKVLSQFMLPISIIYDVIRC